MGKEVFKDLVDIEWFLFYCLLKVVTNRKIYIEELHLNAMANDEIKPGSFREIEEIPIEEFPWKNPDLSQKPKIYFADDLISIYTAFRDQVHNPKSVLYPSCGFDASPARVFPNVTFVDIEHGSEGCVAALKEAGLNAIKTDIREYRTSEAHDLLVLLNPAINPEWATRHLIRGGYVIANDYHNSASRLAQQPDQFLLFGTIDFIEQDRRKNDNRAVISRNIEDLFVPVENIEEFARLRPDDFNFTKEMVESFAERGILKVHPSATLREKWEAHMETMKLGMPYKRVAERYIFVKK